MSVDGKTFVFKNGNSALNAIFQNFCNLKFFLKLSNKVVHVHIPFHVHVRVHFVREGGVCVHVHDHVYVCLAYFNGITFDADLLAENQWITL